MSSELTSLNRVFHRLALVDTSLKLTAVLDKLLPRLLKRIGANSNGSSPEKAAIHTKLVEMMSHVLKRVRDDKDVKLPCHDLLQLLVVVPSNDGDDTTAAAPQAAPDVHPLTFNLTLTFLGIGIQRCDDSLELVPLLLALLETHTTEQQDQLVAHLFLTAVEQQTPCEQHASHMDLARSIARHNTYNLFLDVLLFQPGPNPNLPSPGLSTYSQARLLSNTTWNQRWLSMKQVVLDMISPRNNLLPHNDTVVLLVLASSAAAHHDVAQRAQTYLKQRLESPAHSKHDTLPIPTELLQLCIASTHNNPQHRRRPLDPTAAATVMDFCATSVTHHTDVAVKVAVARLQEEDATIKRAAAQLLRAVATTLDSVPLLHQCRDAAQSILEKETGTVLLVVRDAAYGILATVARQLPMTDLETAKLLFRCVAQEEERLRPRAVAALDAVSSSLQRHVKHTPTIAVANNPWGQVATQQAAQPADHDRLGKSLVPLLWTAAQTYQPKASRAAAAHWADELLRHVSLPAASHILCFLAGDPDSSSIAQEGLLGKSSAVKLPAFGDVSPMLFSTEQAPGRVKRYADFSSQGKATCLRFVLNCFVDDMYAGDDDHRPLDLYLAALTTTLGDPSIHVDLLDACSECFLSVLTTSVYARSQLLSSSSVFPLSRIEEMVFTVDSSRARRHLAGAFGTMVEDQGSKKTTSWMEDTGVKESLKKCAAIITGTDRSNAGKVHGALFLSAHIIRAVRLSGNSAATTVDDPFLWSNITTIITEAGKGLTENNELLGHACADSLAISYSYDDLDAPVLDNMLFACSASVLGLLSQALKRFGHGDTMHPIKAVKMVKTAGSLLAATTSASSDEQIGTKRFDCAHNVYELLGSAANRKDEDISMFVGDALGDYADGFSPRNALWSHPGNWPDEFSDSFASQLPPHENVLFVLLRKVLTSSKPQVRNACAPALLGVVARGVSKIRADPAQPRFLACALMHHLDLVQEAFISILSDSRSTQFSRESSCLGLAACRGLSDQASAGNVKQVSISPADLNAKLLRAFGQTTKHGDSLFIETPAQAAARRTENAAPREAASRDTDREVGVGGAAGVSEASLGAFREMASASLALERPDVLYALMFLSVSHPFWFLEENKLRFSASFLLGDEISMSGEAGSLELKQALRPHLEKLIPRILRACHDPNKQTREQMKALWEGLTGGGADGRSIISENFLPTVDSLIGDASNRLWRARAGACSALAEIIIGREWDDLGGGHPVLSDDDLHDATTNMRSGGARLLRLWRVAVRALDDVHGSVQQNGETLARAVRALTIRLCDPNPEAKSAGEKRSRDEEAVRERSAAAAAATCLWWLFHHGLTHKSQNVAGISISTVVGVIKVVHPRVIDPSLPDLIRSLITSMSGLEPAAFNYLQFHAENQEELEALRLRMAQSGPLADALNKCLELLPGAKLSTQERVAFALNAALRQSAGFASRAAVADAVSSLCSVCPTVFTLSKSSSVQLLRAIYFAGERERSSNAKSKMVHALGNLAGLCPGASVRSLALKACNRYTASTGNSYNAISRRIAASTLRAIAVRASDHFKDGGKADIWRRKVLPVAFLGRKDDDEKVAASWAEVWEEGGSSIVASTQSVGPKMFGTTLGEQILPYLVQECVVALRDVSWSRRASAAVALQDLVSQGILAPLPSVRQSTGSEDRGLRARKRAESSQVALCECIRLAKKPRLWNGKSDVITAVAKLAAVWVSLPSHGDQKEFLGWTDDMAVCPWVPVTVSDGTDKDSLLMGDHWFAENGESNVDEEVLEDPESTLTPETVSDPEPDAMDFDQCPNTIDEAHNPDELTVSFEAATSARFAGICGFLCGQACTDRNSDTDVVLPYKAACLRGFKHLVSSLPEASVDTRVHVYHLVEKDFVSLIKRAKILDDKGRSSVPPLVVAGSIDCIAACVWKGIEGDNVKGMIDLFCDAKEQTAWTIHEAACKGLAQLAKMCSHEAIRQHCWSTMVDATKEAMRDRKYWRVRLAGLQVLESLVGRAEEKKHELNLVLEALLPQKETILLICRQSLKDNESKVKELSSRILHNMSWWP